MVAGLEAKWTGEWLDNAESTNETNLETSVTLSWLDLLGPSATPADRPLSMPAPGGTVHKWSHPASGEISMGT